MLLLPSEMGDGPRWFCVRAQTRREHIAAAAVGEFEGVKAFCPMVRFQRGTRRGKVWFQEALFPGYLFARFDYFGKARAVRHARGVTLLLQFGDRLAVMEDEVVLALERVAGEDSTIRIAPAFEPGGMVEVLEGPLRGLEAVVARVLPGGERIRILIEFLGGEREAEAAAGALAPIGNPRRWIPKSGGG